MSHHMGRIKTSFGQHCSKRKSFDFSYNCSLDVKDYVKAYSKNHLRNDSNSNKKNLQLYDEYSSLPRKKTFKSSYAKQHSMNGTPMNQLNSQKLIKDKNRRFSLGVPTPPTTGAFSGKIRPNPVSNQSLNLQKHMILSKYQKIKGLLRNQKYAQASAYLKQIIPYIEERQKKKQLYFWLIASLMKGHAKNSISNPETVQFYILQCLKEFPKFYDVYLYWAKIKLKMGSITDSINIYSEAIAINPTVSEAYHQLGDLYLNEMQYEKAKQVWINGYHQVQKSVSLPIKILQNSRLLQINKNTQAQILKRVQNILGKKSTQYLYLMGLLELQKVNINESCIYFHESLKFNTSRSICTKSLQNLIKIHIRKRDFYAAYYDLRRSKHLNVDFKKVDKYESFLEGVNFVMKKKFQNGIQLLGPILLKTKLYDSQIISLTIKYLGYANFKLGNHAESIKFFKKLRVQDLDDISKYNLLLAEGIQLADKNKKFQRSIKKFELAKGIFPNKVEPYLYVAMVKIYQVIEEGKSNCFQQTMYQSIQILNQAQKLNTSSSNLLFHRAILKMHFQDWKSILKDINLCIQKAEQNLPKYFSLRALCYACSKDIKKAINQYSIAISLDKQYHQAILQRAKCYFLLGQTESGFHDLKNYMNLRSQDYDIHKWIGDLLYEGCSYNDSIKAYNQMGSEISLEALCNRFRSELRVCKAKSIKQTFKLIQKDQNYDKQTYSLDSSALELLQAIGSQESQKHLQERLKKFNDILQRSSQKCQILHLIDCMNIIGISSFYLGKFQEAYQSFTLVLQFFRSLTDQSEKSSYFQKANSQDQQDQFDMKEQDILYNLMATLIALEKYSQAVSIIQQKISTKSIQACKDQLKTLQRIKSCLQPTKNKVKKVSKKEQPIYLLPRINLAFCSDFKGVQLKTNGKTSIIVRLIWTPYHIITSDTYFINEARGLIYDLHVHPSIIIIKAGYIDDMPEGPWIKRNQFGVLFTDQILDDECSVSFLTTVRKSEEQGQNDSCEDSRLDRVRIQRKHQEYDLSDQQDLESRKEMFLKNMKLDLKLQDKLNKILKKSQNCNPSSDKPQL